MLIPFHSPLDKPTLHTPPYTKIAEYYDQIMQHVNYPEWAEYVATIFEQEGFGTENALLDIGCGTGKFLEEIKKLGYHGDGCDPSADMLAIAGKRLPDCQFFNSGLPEIPDILAGKYALMTCLYDSLNYLPDEAAIEHSLNSVYEKLKTPGIFVFDLVGEIHCKYYFKNYIDSEVLDENIAYSRESKYDCEEQIQYTWVRIYTPEGVFEEVHQQKIFDFYRIKTLIQRRSGFKLVNVYDEFSFDKINARSGRAHFVLKKH
jgi:SAM-dependent methyltransferase